MFLNFFSAPPVDVDYVASSSHAGIYPSFDYFRAILSCLEVVEEDESCAEEPVPVCASCTFELHPIANYSRFSVPLSREDRCAIDSATIAHRGWSAEDFERAQLTHPDPLSFQDIRDYRRRNLSDFKPTAKHVCCSCGSERNSSLQQCPKNCRFSSIYYTVLMCFCSAPQLVSLSSIDFSSSYSSIITRHAEKIVQVHQRLHDRFVFICCPVSLHPTSVGSRAFIRTELLRKYTSVADIRTLWKVRRSMREG